MIPHNFFSEVERQQKYVVYGDSVCENMNSLVMTNGIRTYTSFNNIWNYLQNQVGVEVQYNNGKEYIYLNNIDFETLTFNYKLDKLEFTKPEYLMRHKINEKICRLNITNNHSLDVTNNHSLIHYDGENWIVQKPNEVEYLPGITNNLYLEKEIDVQYYILGLWFADGSFPNSDFYPSLSSEYYKELCEYITELDINFKPYLRKTGKKNDFQFNYKPVRNLLINNGLKGIKSINRSMPELIFEDLKSDMHYFTSFFAGYYTGDGSFNNGIISFSSANYTLLNQLQNLFISYGIYSHILIDKNGRHYNGQIFGDMYKLKVLGMNPEIINFLKQFHTFKSSKKIEFKSLSYGRNFNSVGHKNKGIVRNIEFRDYHSVTPIHITSKEEVQYNGYVYDFSCPKNQTFLANGFIVHNTDSMYINVPTIKPETAEEAVQHGNKISHEINNSIDHFMKNFLLPKSGVNPEHNQTDFKTELVANGLLLLDVKKNYAFRLLAREGKILETPKVEYTNLTVVKSDTTRFTREFITRMVEDIILNTELQNENLITHINRLATEMRDKLIGLINDFDFEYIGVPKKWSLNYNVEPFQVIAMKLYNTIMNEPILSPMSAALVLPIELVNPIEFENKISAIKNNNDVFINKIPISKLTSIGIPYNYDREKLRNSFEYYKIKINIEEVWDKLYNKTARRIVEIAKKQII